MPTRHNLMHLVSKLTLFTAIVVAGPSFAAQSWSYSTNSNGVTSGTGYLPGLCGTEGQALTKGIASGGMSGSWCDTTALTLSGISTATGTINSPSVSSTFKQADIYSWGSNGFGVVATSEDPTVTGPHAVDNKAGTDAILLNFSVQTNLTSIKLGWNGTDSPTGTSSTSYRDSDLSIFVWTDNLNAPNLNNVGPATLLSANSGWSLVKNAYNAGSNVAEIVTTSSSAFSSYWLISAYDPHYGANSDSRYDAFKLLAISANACDSNPCRQHVPEPGTMALMGTAILGLVAVRRRRQTLTAS